MFSDLDAVNADNNAPPVGDSYFIANFFKLQFMIEFIMIEIFQYNKQMLLVSHVQISRLQSS